MTERWIDLAASRRPAEDRLIDRYRADFFEGDAPATDRGYPTIETPWGLGRKFFTGLYVTALGGRSAWPETQLVLDLFWEVVPDRRVVAMRSLWPPDRWHDMEPPYNELLGIHLVEGIHKHAQRWLAVQPGPVVYFIWQSPVDFANPPAPGAPPAELVSARSEIDRIKSEWRSTQ
jgi:hypothetical protein